MLFKRSAVVEAMMATNARGSMLVNDPVISNRRTIPVSGARTIAEKNPVMAKMMKLFIYAESSPRYRQYEVTSQFANRGFTLHTGNKKINPCAATACKWRSL